MTGREAFGPRPAVLDWQEARKQLSELAGKLMLRVRRLDVTLAHGATVEMERIAQTLDLMLSSEQPQVRREAARAICEGLLDVGQLTAPEWWGTDLGRLVAREIGYFTPWVPRRVAQEVLLVSRQAVHQMVGRGDLEVVKDSEDRAVSRESLALAAQQRWPRDDDA